MDRAPNIIFILADQLGAKFVNCYGSQVDSTPALDKLAARGIKFTKAYAVHPVCAPNRASIFSGRTQETHGLKTNNYMFPEDQPTFVHLLQEAGYQTGGFGKFHLTPMGAPLPENMNYLGFHQSVPTDDTKLGKWLDWVEENHPEYYEQALAVSWPMPYLKAYGKNQKDLRPAWKKANDKYVKPLAEQSEWPMMYRSPLPKELHQTSYITDIALDFMEQNKDNSFFCHLSYVDPHDPYDPPAPYDNLFSYEDMPDPIPQSWTHNPIYEKSRAPFHFDKLKEDETVIKKMRAKYHGSIKFIDDQIARVTDFLDKNNLWENTIIVFSSDHGDMMGDHGLMTKGPMHYDTSVRVPLIVCGADIDSGKVCNRLTSSLDFFPSFCELANIKSVPPIEGHSFSSVLSDIKCKSSVEESSFSTQSTAHSTNSSREAVMIDYPQTRSMITADGWRLSIFNGPYGGELFNLQNDPEERDNLYDNKAYDNQKMKLFELMTRIYMKNNSIPNYRNMPVQWGSRCLINEWDLVPSYTRQDEKKK